MAIEEKKTEEKISTLLEDLASLESYAQDLFSFTLLPTCFVSPVGVILEANPAMEKISGYKVEELIGESVEVILSKEEKRKLFKETLEKKIIKTKEGEILTKGKKKIPVSFSALARKTKQEEITGYFIGFFDLTDIKSYQRELEEKAKGLEETRGALINILEDVEEAKKDTEEEKNKTLAIIDNFADGLLVFDKEKKLLLINLKGKDFFGIKAKDIIGKSIPELKIFPALNSLLDILGKEIKEISRKELVFREGLILEISTISITRKKEGIGTLVILHDITREKTVEKLKTEFVSLSAHQLRTPLSAIKWTLKMLLDGDLGKITEEQRNFLEKTYKSNERMISLVNSLLNITRIEEGRFLYKPILTDFQPIVQDVVNSLKEEIKKKKIKFEFRKPKEKLPQIKVDIEKIRIAVNNLIDNAIKYTPTKGAVTISIACGKKEIEFSVFDNGVGIPKDQQQRIFTKFFRGANVVRMETTGTGLGLYITKNIIEAHGGKIWFETGKEKGATFHFVLPIVGKFKEFLKEF